jgi:predicted DNA-binding protein with PD1-like motif
LDLHFGKEGKLIAFRFEDGEDAIESLKRVTKECEIQSGVILSGIGMIRNSEIGFYSREEAGYIVDKLNEPVELLSLSGNISQLITEPFVHLHVSLAKENKSVVGGHLKKATVHNTLEGVILKFSEISLTRDPETQRLSIS